MKRFRITLDSTVYVTAENQEEAMEKYDVVFKKIDDILKDAEKEIEFVRYVINTTESD